MNEPNNHQASPPAILFVDDEATAVKYFQRAIGALAPVVTGGSVEEGKALLDAHGDHLAVLVSDQRMPGEYGNELLRYARERYPHIVRILTTAYSELEHTVEAVNQGQIHRYIKKPWDITALRMELKQALEIAGLRKERDQLVREKLGVLQRQTLATRIGMVQALCASLIGPGRFQLKIRPSKRVRALLRQGRKLKVSLAVTFSPPGGTPNTKSIRLGVKLKRARLGSRARR